MYLANLKLWNFRKYGSTGDIDITQPDLDLNFHKGLNVLIGENDSGKTAIIDAIKLVLKTHSYEFIKVTDDDFYKGSTTFRIELILKDFSDEGAANFTEWLSWDGTGAAAQPYLKLSYYVSRKNDRILPSDVRAGVDTEGYLLNAQARSYLKTTYLKPLRDAKSELVPKKNSRLSQIFQEHEAFKGKQDAHRLVELFTEFNKEIENYFVGTDGNNQPIVDGLGKELKDSIDGYLKSFYDSTKQTNITANEGSLKSILEKLELLIKDETNIGLGTLNRLFMASELVHLNKKNWDGIRLALIEELEAHLHPQAQMQVVETLQKQTNVQLILSTHSPNLASKVKLENLILCCGNNAFPLGKDYTLLDKNDYSFLERFLDVSKANLFFAKGVVLVEGWGEELLLPVLSKIAKDCGIINKDITEAGVSVINIGNTSFLRYSRIFKRKDPAVEIKIPVALITDLDVLPAEENQPINGTTKLADKTVKKSKNDGQKVKTFVSPHWTLEYCLGLSPLFQKELFIAVRLAGRAMDSDIYTGKRVAENWKTFSAGKTAQKIAEDMYTEYIGAGKKISKSIISQYLAEIISKKAFTRVQLQSDLNIKYLLDAISYACNN